MGSHADLRNFKMTLELTTGVPKIVFTRIRDSVDEVDDEVDDEEEVEVQLGNEILFGSLNFLEQVGNSLQLAAKAA
jgi:hypothetical protein